jgi:hypothetical protein
MQRLNRSVGQASHALRAQNARRRQDSSLLFALTKHHEHHERAQMNRGATGSQRSTLPSETPLRLPGQRLGFTRLF